VLGPFDQPAVREKMKSASSFQLPIELLDAKEIAKRWRGITLPDNYVGLFEKEAGYLRSEECIKAYKDVALAYGAEMLPFTRVVGIAPHENGVTVYTSGGIFHGEKAIYCAGARAGQLQEPFRLPVTPVRKTVAWFQADESLYASDRFPGFTLSTPDGGFYGFPSIKGSGVKIGRHDKGSLLLPEEHSAEFGTYREDENDVRNALETYMPAAAGVLLRGGVCRYEMTPDEHFIIDRVPQHPNIFLACGFSGHGFKFSSVVGEILADLITKELSSFDLSLFSLSRLSSK
jgi:N-methyl-L-tryptophan oxidase